MIESNMPTTVHTSRFPHEPSSDTADTRLATPVDKVRWGAVIAGLFATLATLAVLSVLGLAIGLSTVDRYSDAGNFGIGAGIWGAISALLAFAVGGYVASHSAAVRGSGNGVLQGALVWMVTIGLLIYLVAGGVGSMLGTATNAAIQTGAQTAGAVANTAADTATNDPNTARSSVENAQDQASDAANQVGASAQNAMNTVRQNVNADNVETAADRSAAGAWGLLVSMLLGLGAACAGAYVGARNEWQDEHYPTDVKSTRDEKRILD